VSLKLSGGNGRGCKGLTSPSDLIDAAPGDLPDQYYAEFDPAVGHTAGWGYGDQGENAEYGDPGSVAATDDWQDGEEGYYEGDDDEGEFEEDRDIDA
jgi:hypothetical protein